jgi:hypothetical protein
MGHEAGKMKLCISCLLTEMQSQLIRSNAIVFMPEQLIIGRLPEIRSHPRHFISRSSHRSIWNNRPLILSGKSFVPTETEKSKDVNISIMIYSKDNLRASSGFHHDSTSRTRATISYLKEQEV